jgi:hypothetical protein
MNADAKTEIKKQKKQILVSVKGKRNLLVSLENRINS